MSSQPQSASEQKAVADIKSLAHRVNSYWLKGATNEGCPQETSSVWFNKSDATDEHIRKCFLADFDFVTADTAEARNAVEELKQTPEGTLGLIILLDQFSRNMFRGSGRSFSADHLAQQLTQHAIEKGFDLTYVPHGAVFTYMPLMHAESVPLQDLGTKKFTELAARFPALPALQNHIKYMQMHRDIIVQFGRFPHRNAWLGRQSTPEEAEFMKTHKGFS